MPFAVAAFYAFVPLPDAPALREGLHDLCSGLGVTGTLLLAPEGINGTVAGEGEAVDALIDQLRFGPLLGGRLGGLDVKLSTATTAPFGRLKVKLKREIVAFGDPSAAPSERTGAYVSPADWNTLIGRADVLTIDVRNAFEVAMGAFEGAVDPRTSRFSDFRAFAAGTLAGAKDRTIALYCTGGIRCEKASAHLLANGFSDVRQLKGGVLRYLEEIEPAASRWRGSCFVFDERIALGHGLVEAGPEQAYG
ncbi:rhodanese-related sulfurtransferase [Hansschlegelia sp. KR7-227]|uniref:oxygen-dependent tRNA uridine(34) hydroxylase TrhO n=1 Tax=Hansschlegelia sp. KR7-227 TaxID=3400914 RepID=UPI003C00CFC9